MGRSSGLRPEKAHRQQKAVPTRKNFNPKQHAADRVEGSALRSDETEEERALREKRQAEISALEDLLFEGRSTKVGSKKRKVKQTVTASRNLSTAKGNEDSEDGKFVDQRPISTSTVEEKCAWIDPDDENVVINIAADPKLRKLRKSEKEREISGVEYQRRLRDLHDKIIGRKTGLDWIKRARRRKGEVKEYANNLCGSRESDDDTASFEQITGQEPVLMRSDRLLASTTSKTKAKVRARGTGLVEVEGDPLPPSKIHIRRLEDANKADINLCAVSSVEFHPTSNILMTAGRDKSLRLFLVWKPTIFGYLEICHLIDGKKNSRIESLHFRDFPIVAAKFSQYNGGGSVMMLSNASRTIGEYCLETGELHRIPAIGGRREERCFHHLVMGPMAEMSSSPVANTFVVSSAASQSVLLCDAKSKRMIDVFQMNAPVAAIAYHPSSPTIISADEEAFVYEWDIRAGRCLAKMHDAACLKLTSMAVSQMPSASSRLGRPSPVLALGSKTGFVDIFRTPSNGQFFSEPIKVLGNLTTAVSSMCFHPSNELLCVASKWKKDALRLIHLPSYTVYQNWPTPKTPMHYVTATNFSAKHGLLAVGNDKGRVLLYQIKHFI